MNCGSLSCVLLLEGSITVYVIHHGCGFMLSDWAAIGQRLLNGHRVLSKQSLSGHNGAMVVE